MKVTPEWLERNSPCADGGAWGLHFVGMEGKELEDCLPAMTRADWLLWLLVKSDYLSPVAVVPALLCLAMPRMPGHEAGRLLAGLAYGREPEDQVKRKASQLGFKADSVAHRARFLAVAFLADAKAKSAALPDLLDALIMKGQGCLNMLASIDSGMMSQSGPAADAAHAALCAHLLAYAKDARRP